MEHIDDHLAEMESDSSISNRAQAYVRLRTLGLGDFGFVLLSMPDRRFPRISSLLPNMASEQTQLNWTGASGHKLLCQSVNFMRSLSANYEHLTGTTLAGKRILDFGCGYGRLLRLAAFYSDDVYGVDPWDESVRLCREAGLDDVWMSDYLPETLPVPSDFDLVFAFSVFTHLSARATQTSLKTLRKHVRPGAILGITIRPIEYWRKICTHLSEAEVALKEEEHRAKGFAFVPHDRALVDGDITYGETSMTLDWLARFATNWKIEAVDRSPDDIVQRYVFLRAV